MHITHQADLSILCQGDELTLSDVVNLSHEIFSKESIIKIDCKTVHPAAMRSFQQFLTKINCKQLSVYVETLSHEEAKILYDAAKANTQPSKKQLDLGLQFLVFSSKSALTAMEMHDIHDHLISGIYKDQHTLIINYRTMTYLQAVTLVTALWHASLGALSIDCYILDNETKRYLSSHLSRFASVMQIDLNVHNQFIPLFHSGETSVSIELPHINSQTLLPLSTSTSAPSLAPVRRYIDNQMPPTTCASVPTLGPARRFYVDDQSLETMITIHAAEAVGLNCDEHQRVSLEIAESECECGPLKCLQNALTWAFSGMSFCPPAAEFIADADEAPRVHFKNT